MADEPGVVLEVLPAHHGDCLLVEVRAGGPPWRLLVDGGTTGTYRHLAARFERLVPEDRHIDLFVVSHIDADHIGGAIRLLERRHQLGISIGEIWFNGFRHLPPRPDYRGPRQGDRLSELIEQQAIPWNRSFDGAAAAIEVHHYRSLQLADGIDAVLLSPTPVELRELWRTWRRELDDLERGRSNTDTDGIPGVRRGRSVANIGPDSDLAQLAATPTEDDEAEANGSSIALLLRVTRGGAQRSVLLAADAHPRRLTQALLGIGDDEGTARVAADIFKLPHHASQANVTADLLDVVDARRYVVSTDGSYFHHPDAVALARLATTGTPRATIWFNYATAETEWFRAHRSLRQTGLFTPPAGQEGIRIELA